MAACDRGGLSAAGLDLGLRAQRIAVHATLALRMRSCCSATRAQRADDERVRARRWRARVAAGLLAGLAILVRPAMLFFLPLAALWLLRRRQCVAGAGASVLRRRSIVAPWTVRNARTYGRFVLSRRKAASRSGPAITRWRAAKATWPRTRRSSCRACVPGSASRPHRGRTRAALLPRAVAATSSSNPAGGSAAGEEGVLHGRAGGPVVYATLHAVSLSRRCVVSAPAAVRARRALAGWRGGAPAGDAAAAPGVSAVVACLMFFPQERFRIPVIDPAADRRARRLVRSRRAGASQILMR